MQISELVEASPDRLAVDSTKLPQSRTEYDSDKAHLEALAIDGNMTRLAADDRRLAAGKSIMPWRRARHERDLLGARMGENLAAEIYRDDPLQAGPNAVELWRLRSIEAGKKPYGYIKGAKLPRR